jgi:microcompartment protein CcmL/EutN
MENSVIGVLEFNSIAVGIEAMDAMVKEAAVKIVDAKTICPGKFYIIVAGQVADVDASLTAGRSKGRGFLVDELFIPNLDPQILPAISGAVQCTEWNAIAIIESFSVVSGIVAGDLAAKEANVIIPEIRLSTGMGGKSFVKILGEIHEVEAAVQAGAAYVKKNGLLCKQVIIPRPHEDIMPYFL